MFSVSVAYCSRCASWTDLGLLLGELAQRPEEVLRVAAAEGEEAATAAFHDSIVGAGHARPYDEGQPVAGLDLALQLADGALRRLHRGGEGRGPGRVELALEPPRRGADLVQPHGRRELRRVAEDVLERAGGLLRQLDPVGRVRAPQLLEPRRSACRGRRLPPRRLRPRRARRWRRPRAAPPGSRRRRRPRRPRASSGTRRRRRRRTGRRAGRARARSR